MISLTSPVKTRAHGWPAGVKLGGLCLATIALFALQDMWTHLLILGGIALLYALPGPVFWQAGAKALWVLWPFVLILTLWHLWDGGLQRGAVIVLRMVSAVALANLVTMTTALQEMIALIRWLTTPLRRVGVSTRGLEIAIALVMRVTPELLGKAQNLHMAWKARSPRRANWRILLPFAVAALDDADHLADALKARGGLTEPKDD